MTGCGLAGIVIVPITTAVVAVGSSQIVTVPVATGLLNVIEWRITPPREERTAPVVVVILL